MQFPNLIILSLYSHLKLLHEQFLLPIIIFLFFFEVTVFIHSYFSLNETTTPISLTENVLSCPKFELPVDFFLFPYTTHFFNQVHQLYSNHRKACKNILFGNSVCPASNSGPEPKQELDTYVLVLYMGEGKLGQKYKFSNVNSTLENVYATPKKYAFLGLFYGLCISRE